MFGDLCEHTKNEETLIIHCGKKITIPPGEKSVDSVPAIHLSTSYLFASAEDVLGVSRGEPGYVYRRCGNENCIDLAMAVAQLEGASDAACMTCGMGAISTAFIAAGVLKGGKRVLGPYSCYGSTYTLMTSRFVDVAICELTDMSNTQATLEHIQRMKPDIFYMETSSNPLTIVPEIARLVSAAKEANANCISIIDNTFATPLLVKPLSLGVDMVLHSMTKYMNGHGDALAGAICSNSSTLMASVREAILEFGIILSPWDAWLVQRGLRTLGVRLDAIGRNAYRIAKHLEGSSAVSRMHYPGLPSHPQYQAVLNNSARPHTTEERMISFDINVEDADGIEAVKLFLDSLHLVANQVSLGDVKTLASAPGLSTQHQIPVERRAAIGIKPSTIRLSVGMEQVDDICGDIDQALAIVMRRFNKKAVRESAAAAIGTSVEKMNIDSDVRKTTSDDTAVSSGKSYTAVRAKRTARLRVLYDQMNAITAEMETLQQQIRADNEALFQQESPF